MTLAEQMVRLLQDTADEGRLAMQWNIRPDRLDQLRDQMPELFAHRDEHTETFGGVPISGQAPRAGLGADLILVTGLE